MNKFQARKNARKKPKRMQALKRSKHMKRWLLKNPWTRPICAFNIAAVKIQAFIRGFIQRCKSKQDSKPKRRRKKKSQLNKYLAYMDLCKMGKIREPEWLKSGLFL